MTLSPRLEPPAPGLATKSMRNWVWPLVSGAGFAALICIAVQARLEGASAALFALILGASACGLQIVAMRSSWKRAEALVQQVLVRAESALERPRFPVGTASGWHALDELESAIVRLLGRSEASTDALRRESQYFCRLAEDTRSLEALIGADGKLLWANPAVEASTGYTLAEAYAVPDPIDLWIYSKDRPMIREFMARAAQGEIRDNVEARFQRKDGSQFWCSCRWHAHLEPDGAHIGLRLSGQDIDRRKDAEFKLLETVAALHRTQALKDHYLSRSNDERMRLSALLDVVNLGILFVDRDRRVVYVNQPVVDMWQLGNPGDVVGLRDDVLLEKTRELRVDDAAFLAHVQDVIVSRCNSEPYDIKLKDGRVVREISARVPSADAQRVIGRVWIYEDVTEALLIESRLVALAERDPLTGLYNRRRFHEELSRLSAEANRRGEQLGLLSFDIDGFKEVNDTFGHHAGDEVLVRLAAELSAVVRRNELFFRLGGDEFAIIVSRSTVESTTQLARRIVEHADALVMEFDGARAHVTLSLGIAMSPMHGNQPQSLMLAADRAMYQAKALGKNQWVVAERVPRDYAAGNSDAAQEQHE